MTNIFKYQIEIKDGPQPIQFPDLAILKSAIFQNGMISIYAEVNSDHKLTTKTFWIFPTGDTLPEDVYLNFLQTVHITQYNLVYHIYYEA